MLDFKQLKKVVLDKLKDNDKVDYLVTQDKTILYNINNTYEYIDMNDTNVTPYNIAELYGDNYKWFLYLVDTLNNNHLLFSKKKFTFKPNINVVREVNKHNLQEQVDMIISLFKREKTIILKDLYIDHNNDDVYICMDIDTLDIHKQWRRLKEYKRVRDILEEYLTTYIDIREDGYAVIKIEKFEQIK